MKKNTKIKIIFGLITFSIIAFGISAKKTYTSYQSYVDNEININIADWDINVDNQNIAKVTETIKLSNVVWEGEHTNPNTAAPGSKGTVRVNIDPRNTEVAIEYTLKYIDHTKDPECVLTITNIYLENEELTKIDEETYYGIITVDQIKEGNVKTLVLEVEWINDEENNEFDSAIGLNNEGVRFLEIEFNASQYLGE